MHLGIKVREGQNLVPSFVSVTNLLKYNVHLLDSMILAFQTKLSLSVILVHSILQKIQKG